MKLNRKRFEISFEEYFMYYIDCCSEKKLIENKLRFMEKAKELIIDYMDIIKIINSNQQIEVLKLILLSEKQLSTFDKIYKDSFNSKLREDLFKVFTNYTPQE